MADPDKVPESLIDDSQATYDPSSENLSQNPAESGIVSESQDFQLIDCEESQKPTQEETDTVQKKEELSDVTEKTLVEVEVAETQKAEKSEIEADSTVQTEQLSSSIDKDETLNEKLDKKSEKALPEEEDDEMDFIPSSQQETFSPMKKQLSSLVGGIAQKRKAQTEEEPVAKFQRTCSREDALSSVRKKLDAENENSVVETVEDSEEAAAPATIIEETPESCTEELESESLQQVQQELVETLSQYVVPGEELNTNEKSSPIKEKQPSSDQVWDDKESPKKAGGKELDDDVTKTPEKSSPIKDPIKSSSGEVSNEKESPKNAEKATEDENLVSVMKPVEKSSSIKEKTALPEVTEGKESPEEENMSVDDVSLEVSKELEKKTGETIPKETAKDAKEPENHKEEPEATETKDKGGDSSAPTSLMRKSDDSGFGSIKMDVDSTTPALTQTSSSRSRMSIEVIYDKATAPPKRPRELVEIDEDGEKIVLDSSQEGCDKSMDKSAIDNSKSLDTSYKTFESKSSTDYKSIDGSKESSNEFKSSYSLTNGSSDMKKTNSDSTLSATSDLLHTTPSSKLEALSPMKKTRSNLPSVKISDHPEVLSISDSEGDSFVAEERSKNNKLGLHSSASHEISNVKLLTIEKEINVLVKLKCLIQIDENTKEQVHKVLTAVHCEPPIPDSSSIRRRNSDTSACLADISGNDNRDASPGSVTSNAQPYALNTRMSLASTISSSSSASSLSSLNAAILAKSQFQLPRGPAKHARKPTLEVTNTPDGKQEHDESYEQIRKEWKNLNVLDVAVMSFANTELQTADLHNGSTSERPDNSLERIRCSTPEVAETNKTIVQTVTPKTTKKSRSTKRSRSKPSQSAGSNSVTDTPSALVEAEKIATTPSTKIKSSPETSTPSSRQSSTLKETASGASNDLIGKDVFAKWSDNKYYPASVTSKAKTKYRVLFYDGQHKLIMEDFIVPMPPTLNVGLSVYATSTEDDYGRCGIIVDVKKVKDKVTYVVETDEREKIHVEIRDIFLTNDQVQVLREESNAAMKSPPSTPKHLGKVTLDNVVEGTRRSKRIGTPVSLTPKMKRARVSLADKSIDISKPSSSGLSAKKKSALFYDTTSDSNCSMIEEPELLGVQSEAIGTQTEQESKGPSSRIKGKARSRKKSEDPEVVATLGPMPEKSNLFSGMSFLLTCASLDSLDRFQMETKDSNSEPGTENEEEWSRKPFARDRLTAQLTAGGGKIYENFEDVPPEEYDNTKLIANVPNVTKKSLLCLSVGIKAYNHQWVIRCCQENKIVNPSEEELPAGWSLLKQKYVEMYQRRNKKPFQTLPVIVVIPNTPSDKDFVSFWQQICENAGGAVLLPDNPEDGFGEGTVVVTNRRCPQWIIENANNWSIPVMSTTWVIQCLIEGEICTYDAHPSFAYDYVKKPAVASHISSLKRV